MDPGIRGGLLWVLAFARCRRSCRSWTAGRAVQARAAVPSRALASAVERASREVAEARASVPGLLLRSAEPRAVVTGSEKLQLAEAWGVRGV